MTALYSVAQIRALEQRAASEGGVDGYTLMERAGTAALAVLQQRFTDRKDSSPPRLLVLCGRGNNAGDGLVLARLVAQCGWPVVVAGLQTEIELNRRDSWRGEAAQAFAAFNAAGLKLHSFTPELLAEAEVLVDALLGIGLNGAPRPDYAQAIVDINAAAHAGGKPVLALDCPSGLNADTGSVETVSGHAVAIKATITLSFIGLKTGLVTGMARNHCGELLLADLDIPASTLASVTPCARYWHWPDVSAHFAPRQSCSYKSQFGHVFVLGGNYGYGGAAILTAEAAARAGAGLVSAYLHESALPALLARRPELMARGYGARMELTVIRELLAKADAVVFGPGLNAEPWLPEVMADLVQSGKPLLLDAGALALSSALPTSNSAVLTPHPGEAARLLGLSVAEVEANRFECAAQLANRYQCTVILKGAGSIVASPAQGELPGAEMKLAVAAGGNAGMATAGMGDVLAGITGALLARQLSPFDAALTATLWHGAAADRLAQTYTAGMLAAELCAQLPVLAQAAWVKK